MLNERNDGLSRIFRLLKHDTDLPPYIKEGQKIIHRFDDFFRKVDLAQQIKSGECVFHSSIEHPIIDGTPFYKYCGDSTGVGGDMRGPIFIQSKLNLSSLPDPQAEGSRSYAWTSSQALITIDYVPYAIVENEKLAFGVVRIFIQNKLKYAALDFYRLGNQFYLMWRDESKSREIVGEIKGNKFEPQEYKPGVFFATLTEITSKCPQDTGASEAIKNISEFLYQPLHAILYPGEQKRV
jgi:hypothetical protein